MAGSATNQQPRLPPNLTSLITDHQSRIGHIQNDNIASSVAGLRHKHTYITINAWDTEVYRHESTVTSSYSVCLSSLLDSRNLLICSFKIDAWHVAGFLSRFLEDEKKFKITIELSGQKIKINFNRHAVRIRQTQKREATSGNVSTIYEMWSLNFQTATYYSRLMDISTYFGGERSHL